MAGTTSTTTTGFEKLGTSLQQFVNNDNVLYGIYFLAFFFATYTIFHLLLNRIEQFRGKPAKVIAFMISVISTGGIFTIKTKTADVVGMFHGVTGLILIIILTIAIIGAAYAFCFPKDSSKTKKPLTQTMVMAWAIFFAFSIFLPIFGNVTAVPDKTITGFESQAIFTVNHPATDFTYATISNIKQLAFYIAIIATAIFAFNMLSFGTDSMVGETKVNKEHQKRKKEIDEVKNALKRLTTLFGEAQGDFEKKVEEANNMINLREL